MMLRLRHIALTVSVLAAAAWLAVSCNSDNPAYPRENLKATWIAYMLDGTDLDERDWHVMTFNSNGWYIGRGSLPRVTPVLNGARIRCTMIFTVATSQFTDLSKGCSAI